MAQQWLCCTDAQEFERLRCLVLKQAKRAGIDPPTLSEVSKLEVLFEQAARCDVLILSSSYRQCSALNLASALCVQHPHLRIVLLQKGVSKALESRAKLAGVHELIDSLELENYNFVLRKHETTEEGRCLAQTSSLLCLTSAQGGVGLTSLSLLLAMAFAEEGREVSSLHLDTQFARQLSQLSGTSQAADYFGKYPLDSFERLSRLKEAELRRRGLLLGKSCRVYGGCSSPERNDLIASIAPDLCARLSAISEISLVEIPKTWNDSYLKIMQAARCIFFVIEERCGSLEQTHAALDFLTRCGFERTKLHLIVNKSVRKKRDRSFVTQLQLKLGAYPLTVFSVAQGEFSSYLQQGLLHEFIQGEHPFALALKNYARQVCLDLGLQGGSRWH